MNLRLFAVLNCVLIVPFFALAKSPNERLIRIVAAGDVSPYQPQGDLIEKDVVDVLGPSAEWISKADVAFVNLEAPVADSTMTPVMYRKLPILKARASLPKSLARAGFDIVSLANNHPFDWGMEGVRATLAAVKEAQLKYTGLGFNQREAEAPAIFDVRGMRIAFIAATSQVNQPPPKTRPKPVVAWLDQARLVRQIKELRAQVDIVIVSVHWGRSYRLRHNQTQAKTASALARAGADLILGHHPHVLQPVDFAPGTRVPVAYSLGNFLFGGQEGARGRTMVLEVEFSVPQKVGRPQVVGVRHLPLVVNAQRRLRTPKTKAALTAFREFLDNSPALKAKF